MNSFNIRVYALLFNERQELMVLDEMYLGQKLTKLPGGGLEFGEGCIDCLRRELKEELNLELSSYVHFYTQEDFVVSRFRPNQQLLTIYYQAGVKSLDTLQILEPSIERVRWIGLNENNPLPLPVDRIVYSKLQGLKS